MKIFLKKVIDFIDTKTYLKTLLVFSFFLILFTYIYMPLNRLSSTDDHYFHFRFAEGMREHGFFESFSNFKSIYFSKIAEGGHFIYYNFIFYLAIIPFTFVEPLFLGIKLYAVMAAALSFTILYFVLKQIGVRYPLFFVVIIFALTSNIELWRFFLSRPYTLAPALLLMIVLFLFQKKYWLAFFVSFIYLFWHAATFFLPLVVVCVYFVTETFYQAKIDYKKIFAVFGGVVASIVLVYITTPGFFLYLHDNILSVFTDTILGKKVNIAEGQELYPKDFFDFVRSNGYIFILFLMFTFVEVWRYISFKTSDISFYDYSWRTSGTRRYLQTVLFFLTLMFFIGTVAVSARFEDFFVFFSAAYLILCLDSMVGFIKITDLHVRRAIFAGFIVAIMYLFVSNSLLLYERFGSASDPYVFAPVGTWLKENVKKDSVIFNTSWNWFPQLYYYYPEGRYVAGLEPKFLYEYNPKLYWLWSNIEKGIVCKEDSCPIEITNQKKALKRGKTDIWFQKEGDKIADVVITDFQSRYIVSSASNSNLNNALDASSRFKKTFDDKRYMVYEVLSAK